MFKNKQILDLLDQVDVFFQKHPSTASIYDMIKEKVLPYSPNTLPVCVKNSVKDIDEEAQRESDKKVADGAVGLVLAEVKLVPGENCENDLSIVAFVEEKIVFVIATKHIFYTNETYDATEPD